MKSYNVGEDLEDIERKGDHAVSRDLTVLSMILDLREMLELGYPCNSRHITRLITR